MRNKIKQMMQKEEGFTLVELLAVIVILGIIVAIAIPAIGGVIDRAGNNAGDAEEALVTDAARLYFVENSGELEVTVGTLVDDGYLEARSTSDSLNSEIGAINSESNKTIYQTENGGASLLEADKKTVE